MPDSDYMYVSGEPLQFGTEGRNDLAFHSGDPIPDRGGDSFVYESGTAIGGQLVRQYKLDEITGSVALDSASGFEASIGSSVELGQPGKDGTSFRFVNDWPNSVVDAKADNIDFQKITVTAWVYANRKDGSWPDLTQQVYEQENNVELFLEEADGEAELHWFVSEPGESTNTAEGPMVWDEWVFLAGTYDPPTSTLYRNGQVVDSVDSLYDTSPIDGGYVIGREYSTTGNARQQFNGRIDDVRVYQTALSDQEILDLYNSY